MLWTPWRWHSPVCLCNRESVLVVVVGRQQFIPNPHTLTGKALEDDSCMLSDLEIFQRGIVLFATDAVHGCGAEGAPALGGGSGQPRQPELRSRPTRGKAAEHGRSKHALRGRVMGEV